MASADATAPTHDDLAQLIAPLIFGLVIAPDWMEAMLGQARALIAQTKNEEALVILELVTDKGPADESALQAEAYVLEGNTLQALGRMKEAALAYLHVDLLFSRETALHAEALYNLAKTWKLVQNQERSDQAGGKLEKMYPNSLWRKKLIEGK